MNMAHLVTNTPILLRIKKTPAAKFAYCANLRILPAFKKLPHGIVATGLHAAQPLPAANIAACTRFTRLGCSITDPAPKIRSWDSEPAIRTCRATTRELDGQEPNGALLTLAHQSLYT